MKMFQSIIIYIFFVGFIFSCGGGKVVDALQQTAQEFFVFDISKTWDISNKGSITQDGVDVTSQFSNFTLTFGNKTYSSSGGLNLWIDGTGTWDFADTETTSKIIVAGVPMDVSIVSGTMTLSFNLSNAAVGGRISSVTGSYIINVSQ